MHATHQRWLCWLFAGVVATAGCGPTQSTPSPDPTAVAEDLSPRQDSPRAASPGEVWEAYYLGDAKIGYSHFQTDTVSEGGRNLVRSRSTSKLTVQRLGQTVTQHIAIESIETEAGGLVRFSTTLSDGSGNAQSTTRGTVAGKVLELETTTLGQSTQTAIPWDPNCGGLFADRQSLLRKPLRPGERRKIRALVPIVHQPADVELVAAGLERTDLLDGERELLRIDSTLRVAGTTIASKLWTNPAGQTLKSATMVSGVQQINYRTSKEVALGTESPAKFDLGDQSLVRVSRPLRQPHQTRRVVYRVQVSDGGDPLELFPEGPTQTLKKLDPGAAEVTVVAVRHDSEGLPAPSQEPTAADLAANNLIQSDDEQIRKLASSAAGEATEPAAIAYRLEAFVHQYVQIRSFSQALASAAEVARSREGDCTEHAVLLAALCRAREIPARVAIGLVYSTAIQGFAYHMWNEVWLNDRWVPLDATLGQGGIGAAHLKVGTADLAGATPYTALLPVLNVLGKLKMEIVSAE